MLSCSWKWGGCTFEDPVQQLVTKMRDGRVFEGGCIIVRLWYNYEGACGKSFHFQIKVQISVCVYGGTAIGM